MSIAAVRKLDEKQYDEYLQRYLSMVLHHEEVQLMAKVAKRVRDTLGAKEQNGQQEKKNG